MTRWLILYQLIWHLIGVMLIKRSFGLLMRPVELMGTANNQTSITVNWEHGHISSDDLSTRSYTVQWKLVSFPSNPSQEWKTVSGIAALEYTMTGLQASSYYEIRVMGQNGKAYGPPSTSIYVETHAGGMS